MVFGKQGFWLKAAGWGLIQETAKPTHTYTHKIGKKKEEEKRRKKKEKKGKEGEKIRKKGKK